MIEVHRLRDGAVPKWEGLVNTSDDAWLYHTCAWLALTERVYEAETYVLLACNGGQPAAGIALQLRRRLGQAFSAIMGPAGPLCARGVDDGERARLLAVLTDEVARWARREGVQQVACALPPLAARRVGAADTTNPLVAAGWRSVSTQTLIADLTDEATLWAGLAYDARRTVKAARAAGYAVERADWRMALDDYYRIHVETYSRTGVRPHPRAYFEGIAEVLAPRHHAVLWVAREPGGRPVAFHNCGRFGHGASYWTGCAESAHMRSGVNYLLFWEALLGARADGCRWYDIGEVFPGATGGKAHGLTVFKRKFGGRVHPYHRGELRLSPWRPRAVLQRSMRWARQLAAGNPLVHADAAE